MSDAKLQAAYFRLMRNLNDPDQEDCLYQGVLDARDAVNKRLKQIAEADAKKETGK